MLVTYKKEERNDDDDDEESWALVCNVWWAHGQWWVHAHTYMRWWIFYINSIYCFHFFTDDDQQAEQHGSVKINFKLSSSPSLCDMENCMHLSSQCWAYSKLQRRWFRRLQSTIYTFHIQPNERHGKEWKDLVAVNNLVLLSVLSVSSSSRLVQDLILPTPPPSLCV